MGLRELDVYRKKEKKKPTKKQLKALKEGRKVRERNIEEKRRRERKDGEK